MLMAWLREYPNYKYIPLPLIYVTVFLLILAEANDKYPAKRHHLDSPPIMSPGSGVQIPDDCTNIPETPSITDPPTNPEPETTTILIPTIPPEPETTTILIPTIPPEPETTTISKPAISPELVTTSDPFLIPESVPEEEDYDEYFDTYDYYYYDELDPVVRRRRRDTGYNHGDAFIGKVHNKKDLRDRRYVLKGNIVNNSVSYVLTHWSIHWLIIESLVCLFINHLLIGPFICYPLICILFFVLFLFINSFICRLHIDTVIC